VLQITARLAPLRYTNLVAGVGTSKKSARAAAGKSTGGTGVTEGLESLDGRAGNLLLRETRLGERHEGGDKESLGHFGERGFLF
jgi:hypothetical protein